MRPSLSVRMLTLMARTSVSTWPESLNSARLWPRNPPVNSMTRIAEDIASAIQRRRSAFLEGILRSMSNGRTLQRSGNNSIRSGRTSGLEEKPRIHREKEKLVGTGRLMPWPSLHAAFLFLTLFLWCHVMYRRVRMLYGCCIIHLRSQTCPNYLPTAQRKSQPTAVIDS